MRKYFRKPTKINNNISFTYMYNISLAKNMNVVAFTKISLLAYICWDYLCELLSFHFGQDLHHVFCYLSWVEVLGIN